METSGSTPPLNLIASSLILRNLDDMDGPVMWQSLFRFPVPATHGAEKAISPYLTKIRTELPSHAAGPE